MILLVNITRNLPKYGKNIELTLTNN